MQQTLQRNPGSADHCAPPKPYHSQHHRRSTKSPMTPQPCHNGSNSNRGASYNPAAAAAAAGSQLKAGGARAAPAPMATQHSYSSRGQWGSHSHSQPAGPYTAAAATAYRYPAPAPVSGAALHNVATTAVSAAAVSAAAAAAVQYNTTVANAVVAAANAANVSQNIANQQTTPYTQPQSYGNQRVTVASPSNTNSSSSSNTGSQSGTMSTSLSNTVGQSGNAQEQLSKTNLYIRGLTQSTTDKDLVSMCAQFGTIISTKAILDKNTNKCKGYGFVDFESPAAAEGAVKALQAKGIQAQMAKCFGVGKLEDSNRFYSNITDFGYNYKQQEQDPTNLYIANLPLSYKEQDVDNMLAKYGQVISTRILRDPNGMSKGVGFARMESKEKCEQIIQMFNGSPLPNAKEPLLVKFADGGNKKKSMYKNQDTGRMWRDAGETMAAVTYDPNPLAQNGVATPHILPAIANYGRHYGTQTVPGYAVPGAPWVPQYLVQPAAHAHMPQVDESYAMSMGAGHMNAGYKGDGQHARTISVMMPPTADPSGVQFNPMIPQLTTHMSALQLSSAGSYISPHPFQYYAGGAPSIIHAMPLGESEQTSNAASPDETYQAYQQQPK